MAIENKPNELDPEFQNSENEKEGGDSQRISDIPDTPEESKSDITPVEEKNTPPEKEAEESKGDTEPKPQSEEEKPSDKKESTGEELVKVRVSPEGDKIIDRDQLPSESEYEPVEYQDYSELYEKTLMEIREGEIVTGKIVAISDKDIAVDIGFKSEGTVPAEEFTDPNELKIGAEIEVYLDRVENQEGQLILSKKKAEFMQVWEKIKNIHDNNVTVEGKIIRRIKGGMVVDLMGVDAFLPGSQIDVHPVRDFDALVGKIMDFRIVKINDTRKNVVLSHKSLVEESLAEIREKILGEMKVGNVLNGVVKNITDFGVFVDLGGVDGLLHITDLSWGRVTHPSEIVSLDQEIKVKVLDYDEERQRISLGLKQLTSHPWEGVEERYVIGSKVTGKVVSIARYGAFVELEKGVEGLVHISEMSWTQNIKHPSMLVSVGNDVEVVVLGVDVENRKISLGMKQCEPDPWETLEGKYRVGTIHKGVVQDLVPFGAFVELEEGIEGLVHISDLSWTRKVRHPGEIVKKGEEIEVQILGFDRNERRISLGFKQTQENPWDKLEQELTIRTLVAAKVVRILDKGVVVMLPQDVEGFVPNSHLRRFDKNAEKRVLNVDDELKLVVIEFDKEAKKIILSAFEAEKSMEEKEYQAYLKEQAKEEEKVAVEVETTETAEPEKPEEISAEEPKEAESIESTEVTEEKAVEELPVEEASIEVLPEEPEAVPVAEEKVEEPPLEEEAKAETLPVEPEIAETPVEVPVEEPPAEEAEEEPPSEEPEKVEEPEEVSVEEPPAEKVDEEPTPEEPEKVEEPEEKAEEEPPAEEPKPKKKVAKKTTKKTPAKKKTAKEPSAEEKPKKTTKKKTTKTTAKKTTKKTTAKKSTTKSKAKDDEKPAKSTKKKSDEEKE